MFHLKTPDKNSKWHNSVSCKCKAFTIENNCDFTFNFCLLLLWVFFVLHHFILNLLQNIPIQVLTQCKILSRIMQPHLSENFTKFSARFYNQPQHMWRTKHLHQELQQVLWKWCQKTLMRTVCWVDIHLVLVLRHSPEVKHKFSFQVRKALVASIFLLIIRLHKIKLSLWSSPPSGGWGLKNTRKWWRRKWKRGALDWLALLVEFCRFFPYINTLFTGSHDDTWKKIMRLSPY